VPDPVRAAWTLRTVGRPGESRRGDAFSGLLARYFTGSGIAHLTGVSLARVPVALPPIEEQQEIIRWVDELLAGAGRLARRIDNASTRVGRSSQAVLAKAFRGELSGSAR
jgi:type I restriction enzyme, S subunit